MRNQANTLQLGSIECFCKAAELGSFTAAAEILGVTPAAVSRSIKRIEERLGVSLFTRTTRKIHLTEHGHLYHIHCQQALAPIVDAERNISCAQDIPSGGVKISIPTTYAHYRILPLLPVFREKFPNIDLEIHISNRNIDFVGEGYDLAIRLGMLRDSSLVARKLENATLGVFASPDYLARRGTPQNLEELRRHDCILFVLPSTGRAMPRLFKENSIDIDFSFDSATRYSEDVLGCVTYARAGGGIFQIYHFIAEESVKKGELVEILPMLRGRSRPFSILYPHNRYQSAKVRAFVDFIQEKLIKHKT